MNAGPNRWGKYRIPTARKVGNDYTAGAFFVTWCVKGRVECLARIEDGRSFPTPIGMVVDEEWRNTARVRPNVILDAWVVMPDHVHGILMIRPVEPARWAGSNEARGDVSGGLSLRGVNGVGETAQRETAQRETAQR